MTRVQKIYKYIRKSTILSKYNARKAAIEIVSREAQAQGQ